MSIIKPRRRATIGRTAASLLLAVTAVSAVTAPADAQSAEDRPHFSNVEPIEYDDRPIEPTFPPIDVEELTPNEPKQPPIVEVEELTPPDEPEPPEEPPVFHGEPFPPERCAWARANQGLAANVINGTPAADVLIGTPGPDWIFGFGGDDEIFGLDGDDLICAGTGNDIAAGGSGDDLVFGEEGNDELFGDHQEGKKIALAGARDGDDRVYGGRGGDDVKGGGGNDRLYGQYPSVIDETVQNRLWGQEGRDLVVGANGPDQLFGDEGADEVVGHAGNDTIKGGLGDDVLSGNTGNDKIFGHTTGSLRIPLKPKSGSSGLVRMPRCPGNLNEVGPNEVKPGADESDADRILGGPGEDVVRGGPHNDCIQGDADFDQLLGDADQDYIIGGAGPDHLFGGSGSDTLHGELDGAVDRLYGGSNPPGQVDQLIGDIGTNNPAGIVDLFYPDGS